MSEEQLTGKEKQARIDSLRKINSAARGRLPADFCDMVDKILLEAEDVASDAVQ